MTTIMTLAKWYRFWIGFSITFAALSFYFMLSGIAPFWQAGCCLLQCFLARYWLNRLGKEKKRLRENNNV